MSMNDRRYEHIFGRYRLDKQSGRRRVIKYYYVAAPIHVNGSVESVRFQEAWWQSVSGDAELAFIYDAVFHHKQQRLTITNTADSDQIVTYACRYVIKPSWHKCLMKRLEYAIDGRGRLAQLEVILHDNKEDRIELHPGRSLSPVPSQLQLYGKAEIVGQGDTAGKSLVLYCRLDDDGAPEWMKEEDIGLDEAVAFSVNAIDRVGSDRYAHPHIQNIAFLELDAIDRNSAAKALIKCLRLKHRAFWLAIGSPRVGEDGIEEEDNAGGSGTADSESEKGDVEDNGASSSETKEKSGDVDEEDDSSEDDDEDEESKVDVVMGEEQDGDRSDEHVGKGDRAEQSASRGPGNETQVTEEEIVARAPAIDQSASSNALPGGLENQLEEEAVNVLTRGVDGKPKSRPAEKVGDKSAGDNKVSKVVGTKAQKKTTSAAHQTQADPPATPSSIRLGKRDGPPTERSESDAGSVTRSEYRKRARIPQEPPTHNSDDGFSSAATP